MNPKQDVSIFPEDLWVLCECLRAHDVVYASFLWQRSNAQAVYAVYDVVVAACFFFSSF